MTSGLSRSLDSTDLYKTAKQEILGKVLSWWVSWVKTNQYIFMGVRYIYIFWLSVYCEIIINRGVVIFADFMVHLNHEIQFSH
jgi:hypothetical protein